MRPRHLRRLVRQRRRPVGHVAAAVAADADIGLFGMADETLEHAQPRAVLADHRRRLVGQDALIAVGLEELADPEAARVAPGLLGRQGVVGADHLVAVGHVRARAEEQRAVAVHVLEEPVVAIGHHLDVLGGDVVGDVEHLVVGVAEDDLAVVAPADAGGLRGRQDLRAVGRPPRASPRRACASW